MIYVLYVKQISGCVYTMNLFTPYPISPFEAISACEKAEKWQHALALLADLASRPSSDPMQAYLEDHPRMKQVVINHG